MKKTYIYSLVFVLAAFTACTKLPVQTPDPSLSAGGQSKTATLNITLQAADYQKLPSSDYPYKALTIDNDADAENFIPVILNSEYGTVADNSTAVVTYAKSALYFKLADSVYNTTPNDPTNQVYYSLTAADYLKLPTNTGGYTDFSVMQLIQWLPYGFPGLPNNTLKVVNWTIYPATTVPAPPLSFLYTNKTWVQAYQISAAQYASVGLGKYGQFTSTQLPKLSSYFNAFLKADITIQDTISKGDIEYVSYNYYDSGKAFQKVMPLVYDGNNYNLPAVTTGTLNFIKKAGQWGFVQPLPVIAYTLSTPDITLIENGTAGTAGARSNLAQYGDFDSDWTTAYMNDAVIAVLTADFKAPATNTIYAVTYPRYNSPAPNPLKFIWDGTKWVAQQ